MPDDTRLPSSSPAGNDTPSAPLCYTIAEACVLAKISRSAFYKLQSVGGGPRCCRIGRRVVIRAAELERWLLSREDD